MKASSQRPHLLTLMKKTKNEKGKTIIPQTNIFTKRLLENTTKCSTQRAIGIGPKCVFLTDSFASSFPERHRGDSVKYEKYFSPF